MALTTIDTAAIYMHADKVNIKQQRSALILPLGSLYKFLFTKIYSNESLTAMATVYFRSVCFQI